MGGSQGCCPGPVTMEHLGSHTHGGGDKLSGDNQGLWELPSPPLSLSFRNGGERRWAEVVQCRVPGTLWSLLPLGLHLQLRSNLHCRGSFLLGCEGPID